jgi:hypothetical protein
MKGRSLFSLLFVASLGLVSLATAECITSPDIDGNDIATEATESEHESMSTSESKINGIIKAIDLRNPSIQIKVKSCGMTTIVVRSDTKIRRNGKIVKLSSLKIGDKVAVKNPS